MTLLRPPQTRPEVIVGLTPMIEDPATATQVGARAAPLGRERLLFALPLGKRTTPQLKDGLVLNSGYYVADPSGNLIGERAPLWIPRMLAAPRTEDTRR